jgi:hypothetical protein
MTDTDREYEYKVLPFEPENRAEIAVNDDYHTRAADGLNFLEAAHIATDEIAEGPEWPGIVPSYWQPEAWLTAYGTAYAEAWARKVKEAAEAE